MYKYIYIYIYIYVFIETYLTSTFCESDFSDLFSKCIV